MATTSERSVDLSAANRTPIAPAKPNGRLSLVTVSGPTMVKLGLEPSEKLTYTIGRQRGQDLQLDDPASRQHAMLVCDQETTWPQWYLIDTKSKNGTQLNGVQLEADRRYPVRAGDLVQIAHWTFRFTDPASPESEKTIVRMVDDSGAPAGTISEIGHDAGSNLAHQRLSLLIECAKAIHQAEDEQSLAKAVIEAAIVGTGFPNAAMLRPMGEDNSIDVVCARGATLSNVENPQISSSLVKRAQTGKPYRMTHGDTVSSLYHSVQSLGIDEALCVPIILSGMTTGILYLDSRGESAYNDKHAADSADFAVCIAQLAAMAMANLMRRDLEVREAMMQAELNATGEAQRLILPLRRAVVGAFEYIGENRPGRTVSGDFLDIVPLDRHRVAVSLGDVSGKGMVASVLMTVSVGFLRAALQQYGDPGMAVSALNEYLYPRCDSGRFLTLWTAVIDAEKQEMVYTDAGHGYAFRFDDYMSRQQLNEGTGLPVGVVADSSYQSLRIKFQPGHRLFVISDGIVEQMPANSAQRKHQFGESAACEILCSAPTASCDHVEALFAALEEHVGAPQLDDDATALVLQYAS